jgi:hypothetical protein
LNTDAGDAAGVGQSRATPIAEVVRKSPEAPASGLIHCDHPQLRKTGGELMCDLTARSGVPALL